jgi:hypothetical protein
LNLYLFHIYDLEGFFGDELTIFCKLFKRATDYLDTCRQTVYRFHQVKLKNAFIIQVLISFQLVKNSFGKFPLVAKKEFAKAFKTLTGFYIQSDIKGCLAHRSERPATQTYNGFCKEQE